MCNNVLCRLERPFLFITSPDRVIHARRITPGHQHRDLSAELGQLEGASNCSDDRSSSCTSRPETSQRRKGRVAPSLVRRHQRFFAARRPCDCCRVSVFGLLVDGKGHGPDESHTRERCKGAYIQSIMSAEPRGIFHGAVYQPKASVTELGL